VKEKFKMANNPDKVTLERALDYHDCIKMSTDLPLFNANKRKDTISGRGLI
jgi:hypothetical protein